MQEFKEEYYNGRDRMNPTIENRIKNNTTDIANNPAFPTKDKDGNPINFIELLSYKRFLDVVKKAKHYTGLQDVSGENGFMRLQMKLQESIMQIFDIERQHRPYLEKLGIDLITEEMELPKNAFKIDAKIVDMGTIEKDGFQVESKEPSKEQVENEFQLQSEEFEMTPMQVFELEKEKRRFINLLIQGASKKGHYMFEFRRTELNRLHPELANLYGIVMSINDLTYWLMPENIIEQMANNPQAVAGKEEIEEENDETKIKTQAICFPVSVHENIKGVMEVFGTHGLPDSKEAQEMIFNSTDTLMNEVWDIRLGVVVWEKFLRTYPMQVFEEGQRYIQHYVFSRFCALDSDEFFNMSKQILLGSPIGDKFMQDMVTDIVRDIQKSDLNDVLGNYDYDDEDEDESFYKKGGNVSSIEKRVKEVNNLIALGNTNNLQVVDSTNTWEAPMKYNLLKYTNGVLYVSYQELDLYGYLKRGTSQWKKENYKVGKNEMGQSIFKGSAQTDTLTQIANMYRKALREADKRSSLLKVIDYDTYSYGEGGGVGIDGMNNSEMFRCFTALEDDLRKSEFAIEDKIIDSQRNLVVYFRNIGDFSDVEKHKLERFLSKYTDERVKPDFCKVFKRFEIKGHQILSYTKTDIYGEGGEIKTWNELQEIYPTNDYYVANLEVDSFSSGTTKRYAVVHKKTGEKSKSGRTLYESEMIYYLSDGKGRYRKSDNPYKATIQPMANGGTVSEEIGYINRRINNLQEMVSMANEDEKPQIRERINELKREIQNLEKKGNNTDEVKPQKSFFGLLKEGGELKLPKNNSKVHFTDDKGGEFDGLFIEAEGGNVDMFLVGFNEGSSDFRYPMEVTDWHYLDDNNDENAHEKHEASETVEEEREEHEYDVYDNKRMLKNQAVEIEHHSEELNNQVKITKQVPAWVIAKMERATTDLSDITHYLDGENKMAFGGKVGDVNYDIIPLPSSEKFIIVQVTNLGDKEDANIIRDFNGNPLKFDNINSAENFINNIHPKYPYGIPKANAGMILLASELLNKQQQQPQQQPQVVYYIPQPQVESENTGIIQNVPQMAFGGEFSDFNTDLNDFCITQIIGLANDIKPIKYYTTSRYDKKDFESKKYKGKVVIVFKEPVDVSLVNTINGFIEKAEDCHDIFEQSVNVSASHPNSISVYLLTDKFSDLEYKKGGKVYEYPPKKINLDKTKKITTHIGDFNLGLITKDFVYFVNPEEGDDNGNTIMYNKKGELLSDNYFASNDLFETLENESIFEFIHPDIQAYRQEIINGN